MAELFVILLCACVFSACTLLVVVYFIHSSISMLSADKRPGNDNEIVELYSLQRKQEAGLAM